MAKLKTSWKRPGEIFSAIRNVVKDVSTFKRPENYFQDVLKDVPRNVFRTDPSSQTSVELSCRRLKDNLTDVLKDGYVCRNVLRNNFTDVI